MTENDAALALYEALSQSADGDPYIGEFSAEYPVTIDGHFDLLAVARKMSAMTGEATPTEIEITPEMIEAGAEAILGMELDGVFSSSLARKISSCVLVAAMSALSEPGEE